MRILSLGTILILILLVTGAARAVEYKCTCQADQKSAVEAIPDPNMQCSETFTSYDSDVTVQETYIKLKVEKKDLVNGNDWVNFDLRPRNGYCIYRVVDNSSDKALLVSYSGLCDDSYWITIQDLGLHQKDSTTTLDWTGRLNIEPAPASASSKSYYGLLYYVAGSDGKRYLGAACLQNR